MYVTNAKLSKQIEDTYLEIQNQVNEAMEFSHNVAEALENMQQNLALLLLRQETIMKTLLALSKVKSAEEKAGIYT